MATQPNPDNPEAITMYDYNDNDYNYNNLTLDDVISSMTFDSDLDPLLQEDLGFDYSSDYSEE